ncbi:UNVERIFIED_CONTAM: hypothetical protein H355_003429 [Colinus virginianus]|nr:hypothetical protein H355_003429 [Colinus virginianus]
MLGEPNIESPANIDAAVSFPFADTCLCVEAVSVYTGRLRLRASNVDICVFCLRAAAKGEAPVRETLRERVGETRKKKGTATEKSRRSLASDDLANVVLRTGGNKCSASLCLTLFHTVWALQQLATYTYFCESPYASRGIVSSRVVV